MYHSDTEILFPMRVAPELRDLRGSSWRELVDRVCRADDASLEHLAFTMTIIRLSNCLSCHTHSYRALQGCTLCSIQTIRRFRGDDEELIALYAAAHEELSNQLQITTQEMSVEKSAHE
jgi:hypothetical protein